MDTADQTKAEPGAPSSAPPSPLGLDRDLAFAEAERRLLGRVLQPVTLDRFVVLHRLGQGAMGVVYAAHDPKLDRKVALKLVDTGGFGSEGVREAQDRLEREARAAADLSHPNIVTIYDTGTVGDQVFLAMEMVDGETLRRWLQTTRTWREIVTLFIEIGRGLAAAHAKGIVHRDFKPDNVLVGKDGRPRVVDFGLARPISTAMHSSESLDDTRTQDGEGEAESGSAPATASRDTRIAGTPAYMAPEQYEGRNIGAHSDQFGFCVALYEALLGERPFQGKGPAALAASVIEGRRAPVPRNHGVPPGILAVVSRGLATSRDDRHRSMHHLIGELARARDLRRRRLMLGVGALGLSVSVAGTYAVATATVPEPPDPCEAAADPLREVWNDERRDALAQTMAGHSGWAAGIWDKVDPKLARFADRWTDQREDACQSAQHRGAESTRMLELRYACLDRALVRLDVLLESLEDAESLSPDFDGKQADSIDQLWKCEDRERLVGLMDANGLADQTDTTRLADGLERWEQGYETLARAELAMSMGKGKEATAQATKVVEDAERDGLRGLEAEARLAVGRWSDDTEQLERALDLSVAASTPSQSAEIGIAIAEQATTAGNGDPVAAHEHLRYATRFLERAGPSYEGSLAVRILSVQGSLALREGDNAKAHEHFLEALTLARKTLGPDHTDTLVILGNLAVSFSRMGNSAKATETYEQLLETQARVVGAEHPMAAPVLLNLGIVALGDRDLDRAEGFLLRAKDIWVKVFGAEHPQVSTPMEALGEVYRHRKDYDRAKTVHTGALALREEAVGQDHPALCSILDSLGDIAYAQGQPEAAEVHYRRALKIRRGADFHLDMTLTKLGGMLAAEAPREEGVGMLEEALTLRSREGQDPLSRAETEMILARSLAAADPARAKTLAEGAIGRLRAAKGRREQERGEAERWYLETFGAAAP
ncbi:MAG: serine/threonine-protein kinase [Myxococcota bacterium]